MLMEYSVPSSIFGVSYVFCGVFSKNIIW